MKSVEDNPILAKLDAKDIVKLLNLYTNVQPGLGPAIVVDKYRCPKETEGVKEIWHEFYDSQGHSFLDL